AGMRRGRTAGAVCSAGRSSLRDTTGARSRNLAASRRRGTCVTDRGPGGAAGDGATGSGVLIQSGELTMSSTVRKLAPDELAQWDQFLARSSNAMLFQSSVYLERFQRVD